MASEVRSPGRLGPNRTDIRIGTKFWSRKHKPLLRHYPAAKMRPNGWNFLFASYDSQLRMFLRKSKRSWTSGIETVGFLCGETQNTAQNLRGFRSFRSPKSTCPSFLSNLHEFMKIYFTFDVFFLLWQLSWNLQGRQLKIRDFGERCCEFYIFEGKRIYGIGGQEL